MTSGTAASIACEQAAVAQRVIHVRLLTSTPRCSSRSNCPPSNVDDLWFQLSFR